MIAKWFLLFVALFGAGLGNAFLAKAESLSVSLSSLSIPLYGHIEMRIKGVGLRVQPVDPECVAIDAKLISPSGKTIVVPGFAMHETVLTNGTQKRETNRPLHKTSFRGRGFAYFKATGPWKWLVRFTPQETGNYSGKILVATSGKIRQSDTFRFYVSPSTSKGMIRIARENPFAFEYEDGTPYIPVGHNLCWTNNGNRLHTYKRWIERLSANGGNYIRIWLGAQWCFGIEGSKPYSFNEDAATLMDEIVAVCEKNGIGILLCFDYIRRFVPKGGKYRADYPYMKKNGGPCKTEDDFLNMPDAWKQWKALQRYIVARWGASSAIFAWELWNEMDTFKGSSESVVRWTDRMCKHLKQIDSYRHLTTNSLGGGIIWPSMWDLESIDFVQYHEYGGDRYKGKAQYEVYAKPISELRKFGKPVLLSECGLVKGHWAGNYDATNAFGDPKGPKDHMGYAFHEAMWVGFFAGGAGVGMHWWWDQMIDPFDYYRQYKAFVIFVSDLPINIEPFPPVESDAHPNNLISFARGASWGAIAWVINKKDNWRTLVFTGKRPEKVTGASIFLPVGIKGTYKVQCMDPWTGKMLQDGLQDSIDGSLKLNLPPFLIDIAVKCLRTGR